MKTMIASYDDMTLGQATSMLWFANLGGDWEEIPAGELKQALALERAAIIVAKLINSLRIDRPVGP